MRKAIEDPKDIFTSKAKAYDKFRWDYSSEAIEFIVRRTSINQRSMMADIGAGTGILTKHFLDVAGITFAVEPNVAMRNMADARLGSLPGYRSISAQAEATSLDRDSLDLVVVGQALHWFEDRRAAEEFKRILKPTGWLAILWNRVSEGSLSRSIDELFAKFSSSGRKRTDIEPMSPYFQDADHEMDSYEVEHSSDWEQFLGGLATASWAPNTNLAEFECFAKSARAIFDQHKSGQKISFQVITQVVIGQPNR